MDIRFPFVSHTSFESFFVELTPRNSISANSRKTTTMKYAIIEDEYIAQQQLQDLIRSFRPAWQLEMTAESIEESIEYFSDAHGIDLIFMDIELADGNCFEIFKEVKIDIPVIFTTAYDEYAIQAFSINSVQYLLKPLAEEDLHKAIVKFETVCKPREENFLYQRLAMKLNPYRNRILTLSGDNYVPVLVNEIAFFLSEDKCVYAYLLDGRRKLTEFSNLNEVLENLNPNDFTLISRNVVTSIYAVKQVARFFKGRLLVTVVAGTEKLEVTVSAAKRQGVLDWLGGRYIP